MAAKRNNMVDILRLAAAFLIVCLHNFSGSGVWASEEIVALSRFAVPLFFLFSGYFSAGFDRRRKFRQFVRILLLAALANLGYLAIELSRQRVAFLIKLRLKELFTPQAWKDLLLFNQSPVSEHLWFLGALAYCLLIDLLLSGCFQRLRHRRAIQWSIAVFLLFGGLTVYHILTPRLGGGYPLYAYRNFLFIGRPFFMMGKLFRDSGFLKKALPTLLYPVLLLVFAGMTLAEYALLGVWELYLGSIMTTCLLMHLAVCHPLENAGKFGAALAWMGKNTTLTIYIVHIYILDLIRGVYWANLPWQYELGLFHLIPIAAFFASLLVGVLVHLLQAAFTTLLAKRKAT